MNLRLDNLFVDQTHPRYPWVSRLLIIAGGSYLVELPQLCEWFGIGFDYSDHGYDARIYTLDGCFSQLVKRKPGFRGFAKQNLRALVGSKYMSCTGQLKERGRDC